MGSGDEKFTVLFGGNRNAYDYAYNLAGEMFLFDSDMEWDINMPWYRDVRTVHGIPGGNFGYRDGSGKYPAYYIDSLPPVRDSAAGPRWGSSSTRATPIRVSSSTTSSKRIGRAAAFSIPR